MQHPERRKLLTKNGKFLPQSKINGRQRGSKMRFNKDKFKYGAQKALTTAAKIVFAVYTAAVMTFGAADYFIPDSVSVFGNEKDVSASVNGNVNDEYVTAKLFGVVPVKNVKLDVVQNTKLVPSGKVFGVKFFTKGVIVINLTEIETKNGLTSPAKNAGMKVGDIITAVDGTQVNTVEELAICIENSKGAEMTLDCLRKDRSFKCRMSASLSLSDKKYKTGIWVRDSTAGIGTMTYYNPENGTFAGLGHGICDVDTTELMPLLRGTVVDVEITDIIKGRRGLPGELKGSFDTLKRGSLTENTDFGVFGVLDSEPESAYGQPIEIAFAKDIHEGKASIYTELDTDTGIEEYEVNISSINRKSDSGKNFVIEITDERLLERTGGIVQGMSGSPVIQDGKLIGAVTHVLVNEPAKGYGLFIENMLCNMPDMMH